MTIFYQNKIPPPPTVKESPYQQRQTTTIQDNSKPRNKTRQPLSSPANKSTIGQAVIPYTKGIAEVSNTSVVSMVSRYISKQHYHKQVLMNHKDQDPRDNKCGVIYSFQCSNIACDEEYIGETSRTLGR